MASKNLRIFEHMPPMYTFKMKKESRRLIRDCPRIEPNTVKKPVTKTDFCNRFFCCIWLRSRAIPDQSLRFFPRFFFHFKGIHRRHMLEYSQICRRHITHAIYDLQKHRFCNCSNTSFTCSGLALEFPPHLSHKVFSFSWPSKPPH
jgi:hypothetical protein